MKDRLRVVSLEPTLMAAMRGRLYVDVHDGWVHVPVPIEEAERIARLPEATVELVIVGPLPVSA